MLYQSTRDKSVQITAMATDGSGKKKTVTIKIKQIMNKRRVRDSWFFYSCLDLNIFKHDTLLESYIKGGLEVNEKTLFK